jgi:hypothetical protein
MKTSNSAAAKKTIKNTVPSASKVAIKSPSAPILNAKQGKRRLSKIQKTTLALRKALWPEVKEDMLWLVRDGNGYTDKKGFVEIPRTLPLFMEIIDAASKQVGPSGKSVPAGRAFLVLCSRVFDERLVKIDAEADFAMEAGYRGERNITTWRQHLKVLKDLGFIDYKEGAAGPCQYVLLLNPYHAAKALHVKGWVQSVTYTALLQRALDIGATDLTNEQGHDEQDDE